MLHQGSVTVPGAVQVPVPARAMTRAGVGAQGRSLVAPCTLFCRLPTLSVAVQRLP